MKIWRPFRSQAREKQEDVHRIVDLLIAHFPGAEVTAHSGSRITLRQGSFVVEGPAAEVKWLLAEAKGQEIANLQRHMAQMRLRVTTRNSQGLVEVDQQRNDACAYLAALDKVQKGFSIIELLVPKRLADEQIGDALEVIHRLARAGRPKWQIYLKAASAMFFVLLNTIREVSSSLLGQKNKA